MSKPLRVLHVFGKLHRGGAETMVMNLYRSIDRSKIQFDFVVHNQEVEAYEKEIIELGGRIYRVPQYTGKNHFTYVNVWKELLKNHPEHKIIHGHVRSTAAIYLIVCKQYKRVTISHSHSTSSGSGFSSIIKNIMQFPIRFVADYFMAPSIESGHWLFGERITNNSNFLILKNAIDANQFKFNSDVRKSMRKKLKVEEKYVIGHIGRFHSAKNHSFLLDVFNDVVKKNCNAVLILIGDGNERKNIEEKIERLKMSENVILTGSTSKTASFLQAMDIFVFPSLYEGLGIVAIEAQASGLPTIVSEAIPQEAFITNLIRSVSLEEDYSKWTDVILDYKVNDDRKITYEEIEKSGYDIKKNVEWLQEFYLKIVDN